MSTKTDYGKFDRFIYWLMAINIFATLIFSKGMTSLPDEGPLLEYGDHGLSVTTITTTTICLLIRIAWREKEGFPVLPREMVDWQKLAARLVHC